jgi:homospermidine synthase
LVHAATKSPRATPKHREGWTLLAHDLCFLAMHVAERDTQRRAAPNEHGEFGNTWSMDRFIAKGSQPSELGWGTHERALPPEAVHNSSGTATDPAVGCPCSSRASRPMCAQGKPALVCTLTHIIIF